MLKNIENQIENELSHITNTQDFMGFYQQNIRAFNEYLSDMSYSNIARRLERGTTIVQSYVDLLNYMVLYGGFLYQCLQAYIGSIAPSITHAKHSHFHIVDYACGQGSAALVMIDALYQQGYALEDLTVTLVEPSKYSIERAELLLRVKAQQYGINLHLHSHNCEFDQLPEEFIAQHAQYVYIHLFANILDLYCLGKYNLDDLVAKIKRIAGTHNMYALSTRHPVKWNTNDRLGFERIRFLLKPKHDYLFSDASVNDVSCYRLTGQHKGMVVERKGVTVYACGWEA